jgi:uncharacterized protein
MSDDTPPRPEITYPCQWEYRVIGGAEELVRRAIVEVIGEVEHTLNFANMSKGGKYLSFTLDLTVRDEAHRDTVCEQLLAHPAIKMVL